MESNKALQVNKKRIKFINLTKKKKDKSVLTP